MYLLSSIDFERLIWFNLNKWTCKSENKEFSQTLYNSLARLMRTDKKQPGKNLFLTSKDCHLISVSLGRERWQRAARQTHILLQTEPTELSAEWMLMPMPATVLKLFNHNVTCCGYMVEFLYTTVDYNLFFYLNYYLLCSAFTANRFSVMLS